MRRFPRDVRRDYHGVATPPSENNHFLELVSSGSSGGSNFVLAPGLQVLQGENAQSPQALPGQQHDGSPPAGVNPQPAAPPSAVVAPSPSPSGGPPLSSQQGSPSVGSATSMLALSSGSPPVQTPSVTPSAILSGGTSSLFGTLPPTSVTTVPTSTVSPSSTSGAAISSSTMAPAVAFSTSTNAHGASFWAGIALVSIAGVATIITLFAWWLRVRKRTGKRPWESSWRWGRTEDYTFPEDSLSSGTSTFWFKSQGSRDMWEPRRSTSTLLSSHGTSTRELQLPAMVAVSSFTHGPYPTVRPLPLELRRTDTSVPGLMQDVGSLHVANLVPGDILTSGDESSRPPTALDDVGTPRESSLMFRPRYLSLNGSGLEVPWIQTPTAEPTLRPQQQEPEPEPKTGVGGTAPLMNHDRWKERLERSSVKPAEFQGPQPPSSSTVEAWRDSLRNNIASALGVFSTSAVPAAVPSARPSVYGYDWNHAVPAVARVPSTVSTTSRLWTLEETRDGAGIVHIRGVTDPTSSSIISLSRGRGSGASRALPPPTTPSGGRRLPSPPLAPRASLIPPRLPHFPPIPEVPRSRTARTTSTKRQYGSCRRASVRRSSSSASEATSVGSEMSRASGSTAVARWARLSEKEEAARRALRQRRLQSTRRVQKRTTSGLMV
ncbi:hypothetical protein BC827DRAFT_1223402 [Russula dissimulans]|nr:hypothetical protein BC827DRAFT_1223402 [Russula dissimulans]